MFEDLKISLAKVIALLRRHILITVLITLIKLLTHIAETACFFNKTVNIIINNFVCMHYIF